MHILLISNSKNFKIKNHIIKLINEFIKDNYFFPSKIKIIEQYNAVKWIFTVDTFKENFKIKLKQRLFSFPIDVNFFKVQYPLKKRLLIADMDSTMIKNETLDDLAEIFQIKESIANITNDAMLGKINFNQAFEKRIKLLKGFPVKDLNKIKKNIKITEGAYELLKKMNDYSTTVLVSGGLFPIVKYVANKLNFKYFHGNQIYYEEKIGKKIINGKVKNPILDGQMKLKYLMTYKKKFGLNKRDIIAVGDGANDLEIIKYAGMSISFKGKPIIECKAKIRFNYTSLKGILYLQNGNQ